MNRVQSFCSVIHFSRKLHAIPTIQPLMSVTFYLSEEIDWFLLSPYKKIISEECNIQHVEREIIFDGDYEDFHISTESKLNFREAGKILGKETQRVGKLVASGEFSTEGDQISVGGFKLPLDLVKTERTVDNEANNARMWHVMLVGESSFVVLDIEIYSGLYMKRLAQELTRLINTERKVRDYSVSDVVDVGVVTPPEFWNLSQDLLKQIERDAKCHISLHPPINIELPPEVSSMALHVP